MTTRYHRFGDADMMYGGGFYSFDGWPHYASIILVTPCSDAGGPENQFWVERGNVFLERPGREIAAALCASGFDSGTYPGLSKAAQRHAVVQSVLGYYGMERDAQWTVQVGPDDEYFSGGRGWDPVKIDVRLRANADLERYIYKERE